MSREQQQQPKKEVTHSHSLLEMICDYLGLEAKLDRPLLEEQHSFLNICLASINENMGLAFREH